MIDEEIEKFPDLPDHFGYLLAKVKRYLKIGPGAYRTSDFFKMPLKGWKRRDLEAVRKGFEQFVLGKGYRPDKPITGVDIDGFSKMMRTLHFKPVRQKADFFKQFILDEIVFEHRMTGIQITLYNQIPRKEPRKD